MNQNFFADKQPVVSEIYQTILDKIKNICDIEIELKKASIHLKTKQAFGGIHPKKNWFDFNLVMNYEINDVRIVKTEQVSWNRFHHCFRFKAVEEIDEIFISLLKTSYQLMS